jgi:hypothetical protein
MASRQFFTGDTSRGDALPAAITKSNVLNLEIAFGWMFFFFKTNDSFQMQEHFMPAFILLFNLSMGANHLLVNMATH